MHLVTTSELGPRSPTS